MKKRNEATNPTPASITSGRFDCGSFSNSFILIASLILIAVFPYLARLNNHKKQNLEQSI